MSVILAVTPMTEEHEQFCYIIIYTLLGASGLNILLTIVRMIKVIDFKKLTFFEYYDINGEGKNKKNNKNNIKLLELGN
jgi:hypothetical protein